MVNKKKIKNTGDNFQPGLHRGITLTFPTEKAGLIILHLSGLAGGHPCVSLKETAAGQCFSRHSRSRSREEGRGGLPPMDMSHLLDTMQGHAGRWDHLLTAHHITSSQLNICDYKYL